MDKDELAKRNFICTFFFQYPHIQSVYQNMFRKTYDVRKLISSIIHFNKENIKAIIMKFGILALRFPIELHRFWSSQLQNNTAAPFKLLNRLVINIKAVHS